MSQLIQWYRSAPTAQMLLGYSPDQAAGVHRQFLEEFRRVWWREERRKFQQAEHDELVRVAKAAGRAMATHVDLLADQLRQLLPAKPKPAEVKAVEHALGILAGAAKDTTALRANRPAWVFTDAIAPGHAPLWDALQSLPAAIASRAEAQIIRFWRTLPPQHWALREIHARNGWIAMQLLEELMSAPISEGTRGRLFEWGMAPAPSPLPPVVDQPVWCNWEDWLDSGQVLEDGTAMTFARFANAQLARISEGRAVEGKGAGDEYELGPSGTGPASADPVAEEEAVVADRSYTLKELARLSGFRESTLRRACRIGKLRHVQTEDSINSPYRILGRDFKTWRSTHTR